jgi:glycine/D-amino acid oxidase-like deaminating enzyme
VISAADVVVVGSGAFGASAAYHLARRGARVALLERSGLGSQTSPRAAGLSSQVRATPALTKLAQRAVTKLGDFTAETGQPLRFTQSGALKIARTDDDAAQLAREVARGAAAGVPVELVPAAEACRRLPILRDRGIAAVTWSPTDCNVEPSELPIGYCRAAAQLGAVLLPHTPAVGFDVGRGGVEAVRTPGGRIARLRSSTRRAAGRASSPRPSAGRCPSCRRATSCSSPSRSRASGPSSRSPA